MDLNLRLPLLSLAALFVATVFAPQSGVASAPPGAWKQDGTKEGVTIYSRPYADSAIKEFKSVGLINALPSAVNKLLSDSANFPKFMPYSVEVRVLQKTRDVVVAYHRLNLPLINDRDYVLRSVHTVTPSVAGPVYHIRWKPAVGVGPSPVPGVQRVTNCQGSWLLEPTGDGKTRATYTIFSDAGGAIPAFLANSGSRTAIRKVYAAIRKEVLKSTYSGPTSAAASP